MFVGWYGLPAGWQDIISTTAWAPSNPSAFSTRPDAKGAVVGQHIIIRNVMAAINHRRLFFPWIDLYFFSLSPSFFVSSVLFYSSTTDPILLPHQQARVCISYLINIYSYMYICYTHTYIKLHTCSSTGREWIWVRN